MTGYIILGSIVGLPLVLGLLWRVNSSFLFFSVMAGELLGRYFGDDAELVVKTFSNREWMTHYAEAVVILLPVIFTAWFLKRTIDKAKLFYLWVPFLVTGVVLAAFALPTLPSQVIAEVTSTEIGSQLYDTSDFIIGVVVAFQLLSLWLLNKHSGHKPKKRSKH
ncbi:MAG: hypothetical protein U5L95_04950 [Candidatus Saccharibacteria bacterium]|nr:hypothetical protein [Candidatus Saccharibacteria bacterium]